MTSPILHTQPSCDDDFDPDSLTCDDARRRITEHIRPLTEVEQVSLRAALGRVLGAAVCSRLNVPGHVNSAMDGYAINAADLPAEGIRTLCVCGSSFAGKPYAARSPPARPSGS